MFPATITITIAADPIVLNRVNQDSFGSEYQFSDALRGASLKIRHSSDSKDGDGLVMKRHNVFFEYVVFPTPTAFMQKHTFTGTIRHGSQNDPAFASDVATGVTAWMNTSTNMDSLATGVN